jgi:hypothetical protein
MPVEVALRCIRLSTCGSKQSWAGRAAPFACWQSWHRGPRQFRCAWKAAARSR